MINSSTKVLPRLEHHAGTVNGSSVDKHGGKNNLLGAIGQGNMFSGVACSDA